MSWRTSSERRLYLPLLLKRPGALAAASTSAVSDLPAAVRLTRTIAVTETVVSYRYDFRDRLIGLTRTLTDTAAAGALAATTAFSFTYDALGRQIRTVKPAAEQRLVYAGGQVIEERDPAGAVIASDIGLLTMDRGGARSFFQTDAPSTGSGQGLGSVRGLADAAGAVVERVDYDPFGAPAFSGGGQESAFGNPYLFRGLRYDADNAFYVYDGRRYDPGAGRFQQRGGEDLGNP